MPKRASTPRAGRVAALSLVAVALFAGDIARAAEPAVPPAVAPDERATELKVTGDAAMRSGYFDTALGAYREAYALAPQPVLLYNMARAEERLGRYADALKKLEQFSETAPPDVKGRVPHLDELVTDIRAHVATITVRSNVAGARVALRGRYLGSTPMRAGVRATEGKAQLEVTALGYQTVQRDVVLEGGKPLSVDVTLTPVLPPVAGGLQDADATAPSSRASTLPADHRDGPPVATESDPITKKWWFWTGIGVAVVGSVALTAALLTEKSPPRGDIAPGRASAPLLTF